MNVAINLLTQRGFFQISLIRLLQEGKQQDDNEWAENRHTLTAEKGKQHPLKLFYSITQSSTQWSDKNICEGRPVDKMSDSL